MSDLKEVNLSDAKPCPFCGSAPEWVWEEEVYALWCSNPDCNAHIAGVFSSYAEAIITWNARV